ncbi:aminopeptidase P N-terminal domain-containing protein [Telmatobacter bradus]|uniref:aminopeptidase P N-terminal domain-containing protein n=1 Tax=Telmatobacter bradus TaxID=474953 RepID=UPI003B42D0A4
MRFFRAFVAFVLVLGLAAPLLQAMEKQPLTTYHARRVALGSQIEGGVAVLFAAPEPLLDFMAYRQDSEFFYLTGWTEPGAALMIVASDAKAGQPRPYREILFLPTRNRRMELYTGAKMDSATPQATVKTGFDEVLPMSAMPAVLNQLIDADRRMAYRIWGQPSSEPTRALASFTDTTLGMDEVPATRNVSAPIDELRLVKDAGEIELMKKGAAASVAAQLEMMHSVKPGVTELAIAGKMAAVWAEHGCERASYAPIVGSGPNSTVLHYSENSRTIEDGDLVNVDAACEYSMYAADITRTVPANGHFTPRQREIFEVVRGAQQAAIDAFVAGKSTINDRDRKDPNSLDTVAYNYINTHGKDLHGDPLGKYWLHGLGHMIGIEVHDPSAYPAVLKPGMFFTIEPGVYIAEEKIGVRLECHFLVGPDGKLIDLDKDLPHTPDEIEAEMKRK